jgi:gamma-glutamyltranspeptidase/glutathione hydrolase
MQRQRLRRGVLLGALALAAGGAAGLGANPVQQPERKPVTATMSPADEGKRIEAKNGVVTSANALASEAGLEMLRARGNAVDAAVATAFAIGVVEPQMSGLGGSGAATVWMKRDGRPAYLDFYAAQPVDSWRGHTDPEPSQPPGAAPATASGSATQEVEGAPTPGRRDPGDLRVVAVPGAVAGLLALHEKFGVLSREQVMAPAIRLAEEGFPVGQILADFIAAPDTQRKIKPFPAAMALLFPNGKALAPGDTLWNPELAESLRRVAHDGRNGFYEGPTAAAVVTTLNAGKHPVTRTDFAAYEPQWKRPLCTDYRGLTVLSAPPPQTGFQILHTLELLEAFNLNALGLPTRSAAAFDVLASALRVGHAEARANGDPNWVPVPANGIVSAPFAAARKGLVGTGAAARSVDPADAAAFDHAMPLGACGRYEPYGPAQPVSTPSPQPAFDATGERADQEAGETTHLSVVDKSGNAVALTITNSSVWGSGGFTNGFFLNDSGFRFTNQNIDAPSRSRWRIRTTTIAPTLVLRNGEVQMVIGAPGGGRIPTEIVQVMVYILDYGLDPLDAVRMPRIFASAPNPRVQVEHGFTPQLLREVRSLGYDPIAESAGYARLYLIVRRGDSWIGIADTRHDGQPRGY